MDFGCLRHVLDLGCSEDAQLLFVVSVVENFRLAWCLVAVWSKPASFVVGVRLVCFPAKFAPLTGPKTVCRDKLPFVVADKLLDVE